MQAVHRLAWVVHPPFWLVRYLLRYREVTRGPPPPDFLRATTIRCFDTWLILVPVWVLVPLHPWSMHLPPARTPLYPPVRLVVKVQYVELPWEWVPRRQQQQQEDRVREIYLEEPAHHPDEVIWLVEEVREPGPVDRLEVVNNPDEDWEEDRVAVGNNPDEAWGEEEEEEVEVVEEEEVVGHHLPRTKTTTRATPRHREDDLDA